MTEADLSKSLAILTSSTGKVFNREDVRIWHELLNHLSADALMAACQRFALEGDGFPTVAKINALACETTKGQTPRITDVWDRVLSAVRSYGYYQRDEAKRIIPRLVWRALGGDVGWEWLCEMTADQRPAYAAQFRQRYQELRESEERRKRLPERLRPRLDTGPPPERKQPRIESKAKPRERVALPELKSAKSAEPTNLPSEEEIERRRTRQIEAGKAIVNYQHNPNEEYAADAESTLPR